MSTAILTALVTRLSTLVLSPVLPVMWPGIPHKPPSSGMWLEARYFPNEPGDLTWDNDGMQDTIGFFQVSVYYRPGQDSLIAASEVADLIVEYFPKGLPLGRVRVRKGAWQSPAIDLQGKSFIPITIPYRGILATSGTEITDGISYVVVSTDISKSVTIMSPTNDEDISLFFTADEVTVSEMRAVLVGTSPSVTWTIRYDTDRSGVGTEIVTGGTTTVSITEGTDVTAFDNAVIPADSHVWLETTGMSGTVESCAVTMIYN